MVKTSCNALQVKGNSSERKSPDLYLDNFITSKRIPGDSATHFNQRPGTGENVQRETAERHFDRNGLLRQIMLDPYFNLLFPLLEITADTMWRYLVLCKCRHMHVLLSEMVSVANILNGEVMPMIVSCRCELACKDNKEMKERIKSK